VELDELVELELPAEPLEQPAREIASKDEASMAATIFFMVEAPSVSDRCE